MDWWKELSKLFLNLILLTVAVFGFVTNPQWHWWYLPVGLGLAVWFTWLSHWLWQKGG